MRCLEGDIMAHAQQQIEANLNIVIIISFLGFYSIPRFPRTPTQKSQRSKNFFPLLLEVG
jgi:hypothetical protein